MKAPSLEFEWELGLYQALRGLWRWAVPTPSPFDEARVAHLADHQPVLEPFAQMLAGESVRVKEAKGLGGLRGRDLLLPAWIDLAPDPQANRGLYVLRAAHGAGVRSLLRDVKVPRDGLQRERLLLGAVVQAAEALREGFGRFGEAWDAACALVLATRPAPGSLGPRGALLEQVRQDVLRGVDPSGDDALWARVAAASDRGDGSPGVPLWGELSVIDTDDQMDGTGMPEGQLPDGTEHQAPPVEDVRRLLLDTKEGEKKVVQHSFEKIDTLDSFDGNMKMDDGADELDEHLDALDEVNLRDLMRGGQDAHSVYKADLDLSADIPDVETIAPDEQGVTYDEWDHRAKAYRKDWCTVYPTPMHARDASWAVEPLQRHRALIARVRRLLEMHRSSLESLNRQLDGEHPDIDAMIDNVGEVRAGRTGSPRVYIRQARRRRDVATTVLLDLSLSADSWIDNHRVLDISREACLVLGEVADALGDRMQILAFASSTRNRCRVWTVKDWDHTWARGRACLGALEPQGYTRIGPALRHAAAGLAATPADARLLLLVSDGKPNDYDKYEGPYGMADVRMALREAEQRGIVTHAMAVDTAARGYLPPMFGPGRWHVVPTPSAMLTALTTVYGRLTGN